MNGFPKALLVPRSHFVSRESVWEGGALVWEIRVWQGWVWRYPPRLTPDSWMKEPSWTTTHSRRRRRACSSLVRAGGYIMFFFWGGGECHFGVLAFFRFQSLAILLPAVRAKTDSPVAMTVSRPLNRLRNAARLCSLHSLCTAWLAGSHRSTLVCFFLCSVGCCNEEFH